MLSLPDAAAPFPQGEGREAPLAPKSQAQCGPRLPPPSLFLRASLASAGLAL